MQVSVLAMGISRMEGGSVEKSALRMTQTAIGQTHLSAFHLLMLSLKCFALIIAMHQVLCGDLRHLLRRSAIDLWVAVQMVLPGVQESFWVNVQILKIMENPKLINSNNSPNGIKTGTSLEELLGAILDFSES